MLISFLTYDLLLLFAFLLPAGKLINSENLGLIRYETDGFRWNTRLAFVLLLIVSVAGTRGVDVGTDYINYLSFYHYILAHSEIGYYFKENEIGWEYLNLFFGKLGVPSGVFFGLVSGIHGSSLSKVRISSSFCCPLCSFLLCQVAYFFGHLMD